tara:strand:+ start:128 stop:370 length:243 start_codon:yes stop_codon:yes gene_type:complete
MHQERKNLSENIKNVPIRAGNNRLIIHKANVADSIPIVLNEIKPKRDIATEPLTLISVIAIVGIIDIISNIIIVKVIASR